MNTGGGIVSLKNFVLEDVYLPSGVELDSKLDQIFGNFSDFLSKLRPSPGYKEVERSPYDGQEGIHAAREGQIADLLGRSLKPKAQISTLMTYSFTASLHLKVGRRFNFLMQSSMNGGKAELKLAS
ncbi:hypothetical protein [Corynebacterium dentalis]|uniref:hypothetical protein n=1 Tax=Corynebacterium dentalis TaxID=2014528 RepID=UPI0035E3DEB0